VRRSRIFRILALVTIFVLLVMVMPATPVLAQTIVVTPSSGTPGSTVTITCSAFTGYVTQYIHIFFSSTWVQAAQVTAQGTFTTTFTVPTTATPGTAVVSVQHTTSAYNPAYQIAVTFFTVTQADVAVSPTSAIVGETVTVTGAGFTPGANANITFDNTAIVPTVAVETNGTFTTTFAVPTSYGGNHVIKATDTNNRSDTVSFAILPSITIDPTSGKAGDTIEVSGTGFSASKAITITCDNAQVVAAQMPLNTESNGSFNTSFKVPTIASGAHEVKASDGTYTGSASFTSSATFSIGKTEGYVGDEVEVSGDGFAAKQTVIITFDTELVKTFVTDDTGSFSGKLKVPALVTDTYTIIASDDVNTAAAEFTVLVLVGAELSQTTGNVGTELTISGVGFSGKVIIKYDDVQITTATAEADGTFTATFTVPVSVGGDHDITASDGTNTVQTVFVMESEAPSAPKLLLPEMGSKSEGEVSFDWGDVNDPSGVTYIFQVATDNDFTKSSILLEKPGLTDSEYALTKEETLESTKKEHPYYWRVRAIDGAANEGEWSTPRSFYVGFSFTLPNWAKYTLMGVVALLIGFIGFLVGRRSAYHF